MKNDLPKGSIDKIRNSDTTAFRQLFNCFQDELFRFIYYKVRDEDTAEDLLQDTFIQVWNNRRNLQEKGIKSYLYTIANNLSLNYIRHNKIVEKYASFYKQKVSESGNHEESIETKELLIYINKAIEELSEKTREVFLLSRDEHFSYKEIAERLNKSISTVESHMVKALRAIRNTIPKEYLASYRGNK